MFRPVTALSRNALAGLVAAMLVVALWHQLSIYYLLWAVWQALGIVLNRLGMHWLPLERVPRPLRQAFAPILILGWLSLARPLLSRVMETWS